MKDNLTVICGDALTELRKLPDESAQTCITSPPYWGLRDYGTAAWEGGEDGCAHKQNNWKRGNTPGHEMTMENRLASATPYREVCGKCGARRIDSQLGIEKTPEEYVRKMVEVFREVRRVLRRDGTLWLNLGDSYAGSGKGAWDNKNGGQKEVYIPDADSPQALLPKVPNGLKPKDLVGIPWRVAFALQADGWWLRSDIIWAKPNPMPESVTDRPTKSHEYLFLLTKSANYFYDAEAIKEPQSDWNPETNGGSIGLRGSSWMVQAQGGEHGGGKPAQRNPNGRNKRSVWTITTRPFKGAHFATFPPALIEPCILAGSKIGDIVLDPFAGSGTTGMVALQSGRRALLIELNPKYLPMIESRCSVQVAFL